MKKIIALLLASVMLLGVAACASNPGKSDGTSADVSTTEPEETTKNDNDTTAVSVTAGVVIALWTMLPTTPPTKPGQKLRPPRPQPPQ